MHRRPIMHILVSYEEEDKLVREGEDGGFLKCSRNNEEDERLRRQDLTLARRSLR